MLTTITVKNVYSLFGYGARNGSNVYDPYAQLMPFTNIADSHDDWVTWYNKWSGNSSQPSSVSPTVQPTPKPSSLSSLSYPPSSSPYSSPLSIPPSSPLPSLSTSSPLPSLSSSSSSSAQNPLPTEGNDRITQGAVEDDGGDEKSDPVGSSLFLPSIIDPPNLSIRSNATCLLL